MLARAASMRREPTEAEKRLWRYLSGARLGGLKFRRQAIIGNRIADFFCPAKGLIVEIDGDTHDRERDEALDRRLVEQYGYRTLRLTNADVLDNMDGVLHHIEDVARHLPDRWPHPNPFPEGEGL
ncbi:endonuclease domain-containing protein [Sphingopyxis indica]|nr:endonuclease domain-containing protein [Sphingopyxis indica]